MKKIFLFLSLVCLTLNVKAQSYAPGPDIRSQMWNTSNTYYGTVNTVTLGKQLDTVTNATKFFSISNWNSYNYDSARANAITTKGYISFGFSCLKGGASTDTVTVTIQQSPDGINDWADIPGITALTVYPTSLTVPVTGAFNFTDAFSRFYRAKATAIAAASIRVDFNFRPK